MASAKAPCPICKGSIILPDVRDLDASTAHEVLAVVVGKHVEGGMCEEDFGNNRDLPAEAQALFTKKKR